jgi:hypothetical protein
VLSGIVGEVIPAEAEEAEVRLLLVIAEELPSSSSIKALLPAPKG